MAKTENGKNQRAGSLKSFEQGKYKYNCNRFISNANAKCTLMQAAAHIDTLVCLE